MDKLQIFLITWIVFCTIVVGLTYYFNKSITLIRKKTNMNTDKVTRVEVIDHQSNPTVGRAYVKTNCQNVSLSLQDDGKTLKIFIGSSPFFSQKEEFPRPKYIGSSDMGITVTFKDKDGNMGSITANSIDSLEHKLREVTTAAKVMGDIFKLKNKSNEKNIQTS